MQNRTTELTLDNEMTSLAVIRPLILQPLAIALHTTDLLTIVIRNRVSNGIGRRVDTEASNPIEEFLLFLHKTIHYQHSNFKKKLKQSRKETYHHNSRLISPINQPPNSIPHKRTNKPTRRTARRRRHTQHHKRIQTHDLRAEGLKILRRENLHANDRGEQGAHDRRGKRVPATASAELEERVPVETDGFAFGSGGGGGVGAAEDQRGGELRCRRGTQSCGGLQGLSAADSHGGVGACGPGLSERLIQRVGAAAGVGEGAQRLGGEASAQHGGTHPVDRGGVHGG